MVKIYKQPFAHGGDTIAIPDASQPDGKMSSADGWTPDYQLPKTDPNYKPVGRQEMNGVFKEVTESLGQVQVQGAASWSADGAPYPINAQVYHSGKQWLALRANSVEPVEGEDWSAIGTAATKDVGTDTGNVMPVGAGGWLSRSPDDSYIAGYPQEVNQNISQIYASSTDDNGIPPNSASIHLATRNTWGRLRVDYGIAKAWIQGGFSPSGSGWTSQVVLSANLLQATGNSTEFPMSQKAVTDALGVFGQPSMSGSATLNGTTDNTVQLTGIVTTLGLEAGDVIRIQYSGYDKLHSVESITNNDLIIVNYEHAGNRGNGSLKLEDQTASVTVTRIAKWYNAPLGLGQKWVSTANIRGAGVTYTVPINRSISVSVGHIATTGIPSARILVDGIVVAVENDQNGAVDSQLYADVPTTSEYIVYLSTGSIGTWAELR